MTPPTLTVVVPTYNERPNVAAVVDGVRAALEGEQWELLFVDDDSPDGTLAEVDRLAAADPRVRRLRRIGRRGLASAGIEGVLASSSPWVALMDGDAQHDPALLKTMLDAARAGELDVVIASRAESAGFEEFRGPLRRSLTRLGNTLTRRVLSGSVRDPLSGFFVMRRAVFERRARDLYGQGFKLLLDVLSASREPLRVAEMPAPLRPRAAGESKMSVGVGFDAGLLLLYRLAGRVVPPRFAVYCLVGLSGVGVHLAVLQASFAALEQRFVPAQALATLVAMTSNFFLNNAITFGDRRLRGWPMVRGLLSFYLACSAGAVVSLAIGELLYDRHLPLWLAGASGALAAAVWNYTLNTALTWRAR